MATAMYFSCADSAATDRKTGSPTCTVSGTTMTFSVAQTGNIGVGMKVTYNTTDIAYIVGKTSTSVWTVRSATGGTPTARTDVTVDSITHPFTSLVNALTNYAGASYINNTNFVTADVQVNIACYRNSANDTVRVTGVTSVTTDATRYVRIYTPYDTTTECNQSQRHTGSWTATAYVHRTGSASSYDAIGGIGWLRLEGLQWAHTGNFAPGMPILSFQRAGTSGIYYVEQCIFKLSDLLTTNADWCCLALGDGGNTNYIGNNVFYTDDAGTNWDGIRISNTCTAYIYNNTLVGPFVNGIERTNGTVTLKNNLIDGATTACISGTVTQTYCATSDTTASGTGARTEQDFTYVGSTADGDLHLADGDTGARGFGADLSGDGSYPITVDIDGTTRPTTWDIGADQDTPAASAAGWLSSSRMWSMGRGVVSEMSARLGGVLEY